MLLVASDSALGLPGHLLPQAVPLRSVSLGVPRAGHLLPQTAPVPSVCRLLRASGRLLPEAVPFAVPTLVPRLLPLRAGRLPHDREVNSHLRVPFPVHKFHVSCDTFGGLAGRARLLPSRS